MIRASFVILFALLTACSNSTTPAKAPPFSQLDIAFSIPPDGSALTDTLVKAGRPTLDNDAVDLLTFPFPVVAGKKSPGGYPIYLIECSDMAKTCVGPTGQPIGSLAQVAALLTPIRNSDVVNPQYHCAQICTGIRGDIVGAISPEMQAFLANRKRVAENTR